MNKKDQYVLLITVVTILTLSITVTASMQTGDMNGGSSGGGSSGGGMGGSTDGGMGGGTDGDMDEGMNAPELIISEEGQGGGSGSSVGTETSINDISVPASHPLYSLKLALQDMQELITFNEMQKYALIQKHLEERLTELNYDAKFNNNSNAEKLLERIQAKQEQTRENLNRLSQESRCMQGEDCALKNTNRETMRLYYESKQNMSADVLTRLLNDPSMPVESQKGLLNAINRVAELNVKVETVEVGKENGIMRVKVESVKSAEPVSEGTFVTPTPWAVKQGEGTQPQPQPQIQIQTRTQTEVQSGVQSGQELTVQTRQEGIVNAETGCPEGQERVLSLTGMVCRDIIQTSTSKERLKIKANMSMNYYSEYASTIPFSRAMIFSPVEQKWYSAVVLSDKVYITDESTLTNPEYYVYPTESQILELKELMTKVNSSGGLNWYDKARLFTLWFNMKKTCGAT